MKKLSLLKTLFLLCALIAGNAPAWATDYVLNASLFDSDKKVCTFEDGAVFSLDPAHAGGGQTGYKEYIKLSKNKTYTLSLPDGFELTKINIKGYTNSDGKNNGEITSIGGVAQTGVTFPARDNEDLATNACITGGYDFNIAQTGGSVVIKTANTNQICVLITVTGTMPVVTSVAAPTFTPAAEEFASSVDVTISTTTVGAAIQYSTDNGTTWTDYSTPITLTETTTIKAKATKAGLEDSEVVTKTYTKVTVTEVYDANGLTNDILVLTKANITSFANGYLSTTTDNWNTGKTYGDYSGDFYNMSNTDRKLTIKVTGATTFEVFVQNSTAGRTYTVTIDDGDAKEITHGGTGVESSGVFAIADPTAETTITLGGGGSSVYPVYIKFNVAASVSITDAGWASFSNANEVKIPAGVTAYYAQKKDETTITLKEIEGGYIPANTGVVLAGAENDYSATVTTTGATLSETNLLHACLTAGDTPGTGDYYTLAVDGSKNPIFKKSTGGTLAAGKAYLVLPDGARELTVSFEETTGISSLNADTVDNGAVYDLSGRRVDNPTKGIYIMNGKKVIVK